tara:strand:- start:23291 stop:24316 length:1026 start_codon:yes stop_codon:yes gene_type:complete
MKKPLGIIWNDVHLEIGNEESIMDAFEYMITKAKQLKIDTLFFAGDLFHSRTMQRLKSLQTFDKMLEIIATEKMHLHMLPGNHDKTIYKSYESFLDTYKFYPNVTLYRDATQINIKGTSITMMPFFSDDMLIPKLLEAKGGDILLSHFEMAGSTNLGRTSEKSTINKQLLNKWKKTYLGHYHNHHEITKDIVHLPSFIPANFGEDNNKGFSILYDDLSYEIIKGRFREFSKISINLEEVNISQIKQLIKTHKNSCNSIRFEFTGSESKLKALDKSLFAKTGIDVKSKYTQRFTYDESDVQPPTINERYSESDIESTFKSFCDDKGHNFEEGKKYLEQFFKK